MDKLELKDYLTIFRLRKKYFFWTALAIFLLAVVLGLRLSNYRAIATVEVATPEVSASTTIPTGTNASEYNESLVDLRISRLQQKVMSISSLIDIITKFNLYPEARKSTPIAEIAEGMQRKIKVELISSALANPSSAQHASASSLSAIAFTVSFDYKNALMSQQVTNELVSRFLDEDLKDRRKSAHETSAFLDTQLKTLEKSMEEQEKNIAEFRAANGDTHPESLAFNQQAAQSILLSIQTIDAQISTNEATLGTLRSQLATIDPYSRVVADGQVLTTPTIQLKALRSQYTTLSAQYGPQHPDVIKLRHQIEALKKTVGIGGNTVDTGELQAQIDDAKTNLEAARKTYGPEHPDVKALQHRLDSLQAKLSKAKTSNGDAIRKDADNPAYLQVVAALSSAEEQRKALMKQKDALLAQQEKYQNALAANPAAEQKMATLARDYDNAQLRYRALKDKKMSADMSESIEQDRSGERLVVINPPELPLHTQPSRMLFILGGTVFALIGGVLAVIGAQVNSQSIIGARHLEALIGVAPLIAMPHIVTLNEQNSHLTKRKKYAMYGAIGLIIFAIVFSYTVMPLDVLFAVIGQKLGLS